MPSHVSFRKLWTCEGEAPMSSRWGCFTDETNYPTNVYAHSSENGAIRYAQVGVNNEVGGIDRIGVQLGVPPSSNGGYSLVIPLYWGAENKPIDRYFATLIQTVSVTAGGGTTISKGGLSMTRGVE